MAHNLGITDRNLRIVIGVGLLGAGVVLTNELRWFGLVGLIPLLTGLIGTCPLYTLFGINTCRAAKLKR